MQSISQGHVEVVAAVVRRGERYLVCRRPVNKRHGGLWEFPGGKIEPGETLSSAAERELAEELDLSVISTGAIEFSISDHGSNFIIHFTTVEASGHPKALEHTAVQWLTVQELQQIPLAPSDNQFVQYLAHSLPKCHLP